MLRFLSWKKNGRNRSQNLCAGVSMRSRQNKRRKTEVMKKEKERFRNHISIVLEQFGSFFYIVLIMVVSGLAQNLERLKSEDFQFLFTDRAFIGALVCLFVILLLIGRNLFVWAKTYISVQIRRLLLNVTHSIKESIRSGSKIYLTSIQNRTCLKC